MVKKKKKKSKVMACVRVNEDRVGDDNYDKGRAKRVGDGEISGRISLN